MTAYLPPLAFVLAWLLALLGVEAIGTDASTPGDEQALRWMLLIGAGTNVAFGSLAHTVFARATAKDIGWETNGFQYEVGFASLAIGLASIYASTVDEASAWITASLAAGLFLLLAAANHIVEILRDRNFAPGNTVILVSDLGVPISLFALLVSTGAL